MASRLVPFSLLLCLLIPSFLFADTIDFEGLPDSTQLTTQYAGLTFTNATVITAGISLNEFEFPPNSGVNVVFDDGGPITIDFSTAVSSVGAYFTYIEPLTLDGFDATDNLLASATSAFSSNDALYGDPGSSPNEFISISDAGGISSITITGDPAGDSFVMDDLTFTPITTTSAPEPSSGLLLLTSAIVLMAFHRRISRLRQLL
jgi:hypothetical protein